MLTGARADLSHGLRHPAANATADDGIRRRQAASLMG